jgi:hypothetical protein
MLPGSGAYATRSGAYATFAIPRGSFDPKNHKIKKKVQAGPELSSRVGPSWTTLYACRHSELFVQIPGASLASVEVLLTFFYTIFGLKTYTHTEQET